MAEGDGGRPERSRADGGRSGSGSSGRARHRDYWRSNVRLIAGLLVIWASVAFGFGLLLAPALNLWRLGRLPLGFWWAQQGAIVIFVGLIFVYAWRMDRLDRRHEVRE